MMSFFNTINSSFSNRNACVGCGERSNSSVDIGERLIGIEGCSHRHHLSCLLERAGTTLGDARSMSCNDGCNNQIDLSKLSDTCSNDEDVTYAYRSTLNMVAASLRDDCDNSIASNVYMRLGELCHPEEAVLINDKYHTKVELLTQAINYALQNNDTGKALSICRSLLNISGAFNQGVYIKGHLVSKTEVEEWVANQMVPSSLYREQRRPESSAYNFRKSENEIAEIDSALQQSNGENVMSTSVQTVYRDIFSAIRQNISQPRDLNRVRNEISALIRTFPPSRQRRAMAGLDQVANHTEAVRTIGTHAQEALRYVWTYIDTLSDQTLKGNLKHALFERLEECHAEDPCYFGTVARVLDCVNGIDPAFTGLFSTDAIVEEIQRISATTNELVEDIFGDYVDTVKVDNSSESHKIDENFDSLKRSIIKDKVISIMGERVPASILTEEFDKLIPEGTSL